MWTVAHLTLGEARRRRIGVIGKWIGFGAVVLTYSTVLFAAIFASARLMSGYVPAEMGRVILLTLLEVTLLLTVSIAGGTRFSTVTNGVVGCGFFGVGFVGG